MPKPWGKTAKSMGKHGRITVDVHPQLAISPIVKHSDVVQKSLYSPIRFTRISHDFPQQKIPPLPLLHRLFSSLSTPPITTTTK